MKTKLLQFSPKHLNRVKAMTTGFLNKGSLFSYTLILVWLLSLSKHRASCLLMSSRISTLWSKSGQGYCVTFLKESFRLVAKQLVGEDAGVSPVRIATRRGLPLIIPGSLRLLIEAKDPVVIKFVLSLLSLYRVMYARPVYKLETIYKPHTGQIDGLPQYEVDRVYEGKFGRKINSIIEEFKSNRFSFMRREKMTALKPSGQLLPLYTSGPNARPSILGSLLDALALRRSPDILESLKTVCAYTGLPLLHALDEELSTPNVEVFDTPSLKLGRLAEKLEAAGKVRIFAITDIWTQSALKPLHDLLFKILREVEEDGTFNQMLPVTKLLERNKDAYIASFDLSAATDRLPINFQVQILSLFISSEFAEA